MKSDYDANPFRRDRLNDPNDYVVAWDVPSIGADATEYILRAIESVRGSDRTSADTKVPILLGPPGYGKTHLFGRLAHRVEDRVLFLFIPAIEDLTRPMEHIQWWVIENLFRKRGNRPSPLESAFCRRLRPSFLAYLNELPASLTVRYAPLRQRIEQDPDTIIEIISSAGDLHPFRQLAAGMESLLGGLDRSLLRALVFGCSSASDRARRWLRGEQLTEDQCSELDLPHDPPDPIPAIRAVAALLADQTPVAICLDQLDVFLKKPSAFENLSIDFMTLLAQVPNLLIVLSCLKAEWAQQIRSCGNKAFLDRVRECDLPEISVQEAWDLIRLRLLSWSPSLDAHKEVWPFEAETMRCHLQSQPSFPRKLLKECEHYFDQWVETGQPPSGIRIGGVERLPQEALFLRKWEEELADIQADPNRGYRNIQDQRLARALHEVLRVCSTSGPRRGRFSIDKIDAIAQASGAKLHRYSFELKLSPDGAISRLILALEVIHNGNTFHHYFEAADKLIASGARVCFLTTKPDLPGGPKTAGRVASRTEEGVLRVVSLEEMQADYGRMECYLSLLDSAEKGDLMLGSESIGVERFRQLAQHSQVIDNLSLLGRILDGWSGKEQHPLQSTAPQTIATGSAAHAQNSEEPAAIDAVLENPEEYHSPDDRAAWAAECERRITGTLRDFSLRARSKGDPQIGPTFARFLIDPLATPISKIRNRAEDLKIRLDLDDLPIIDSQAGAASIDVQLPKRFRRIVRLSHVHESPPEIPCRAPAWPVGQDVSGLTHWLNFEDSNDCHLLVAGTTGSGKSELLKVLIAALAKRLNPSGLGLVLIDPKRVTFNFRGDGSPYLLRPIAYDAEAAIDSIRFCFEETERRFEIMQREHFSDITQLDNKVSCPQSPRIVVVFDEFADLMADKSMKAELETPMKRLGAKARAAGIHLVLATQRPEASVVTPLLRSNLPSRICLRVASKADSNLILNSYDGAALLGKGDLLWRRGAGLLRLQCPLVEADELESILFPARVLDAKNPKVSAV